MLSWWLRSCENASTVPHGSAERGAVGWRQTEAGVVRVTAVVVDGGVGLRGPTFHVGGVVEAASVYSCLSVLVVVLTQMVCVT